MFLIRNHIQLELNCSSVNQSIIIINVEKKRIKVQEKEHTKLHFTDGPIFAKTD
jgi:hypothetical protein